MQRKYLKLIYINMYVYIQDDLIATTTIFFFSSIYVKNTWFFFGWNKISKETY